MNRSVKKIMNVFSPKMKDNSKPKTKIMLYGYFGNNFGDDLVFDMLLKRYPDTLFYVLFTADYEKYFEKYNNVRYYSYERPMVAKINKFGKAFGNDMFFEKILIKICDAAVHIGGSVYQQIGDWEKDLEIREKRSSWAKHFFGISNNFGAFYSNCYLDFWLNDFRKFTNVTFRAKYSYNLFKHLKNVSYAPDLVFGCKMPDIKQKEKTVAVSVINPFIRNINDNAKNSYINAVTDLVEELCSNGFYVKILSFCILEKDDEVLEIIYDKISEKNKQNVAKVPYSCDFNDAYNIIAESEYVVGTRFHASVLGYTFNKKVLPICYNDKVKSMLLDIGQNDFIDLDNIGSFSGKDLYNKLISKPVVDIDIIKEKSKLQFEALDNYISKRRGKIIK